MKVPAWVRRQALVPVVVALAAAVSCADGGDAGAVAVGAGDSAESAVLAEIYAGALSRGGIPAVVAPAPGDRSARVAALDSGAVDLLADHTGALTRFFDATAFAAAGPSSTPAAETPDPAQTATAALARSLPQGLVISDPADGTDLRPRLLVTEETARRDELAKAESATPACADRTGGLAPAPGLLDPAPPETIPACIFGSTERFADPAALRAALLEGRVQAGVLAGPAPADSTAGLTALALDLPAENVVPLFRDGVLDDRGRERLNQVAGELTTDELVVLVQRAEAGERAADLAGSWLDAHAL
ncbi:glycine betaine ABC transporter substrate-binding protein [Nocardia sp. NPDC057353]|uniref:glycine betaine ABC transporter substrate-binding protein n=1 Tax=Nocardia sp. NPDC057353 TaxID=3346104 RepID=UPI00363C4742